MKTVIDKHLGYILQVMNIVYKIPYHVGSEKITQPPNVVYETWAKQEAR